MGSVEIRSFKSRFLNGIYKNGVIYLNEKLTQEQRGRILKHELKHYFFFEKYKFLKPFCYTIFYRVYVFLTFLILPFATPIFIALTVPLLVQVFHEINVSIAKDTFNKGSLLHSMLAIFLLMYPTIFYLQSILKDVKL